jgi:hypothetical protein
LADGNPSRDFGHDRYGMSVSMLRESGAKECDELDEVEYELRYGIYAS